MLQNMERAKPMNARTWINASTMLTAVALGGCGLIEIERTVFPNQATDSNGDLLFVEDLEDIAQDTDLLPDEMADDLRELGLESQDLIDDIVEEGLGPPAPTVPNVDDQEDDVDDQTDDHDDAG